MADNILDDPVVLALIQDRALLEEEYKRTESLLNKIREQLSDDTLSPDQSKMLDEETKKIKVQFESFVSLINEHTKWLEQQLKETNQ